MDVIDDIEAAYEAMLDIDSLSTRKAAAVQRQWREALEKAREHIESLNDIIAFLESEE